MKTLTDQQMRQAWAHLSTDKIRAMGFVSGPDADIVNAGRRRILAIRERDVAESVTTPNTDRTT